MVPLKVPLHPTLPKRPKARPHAPAASPYPSDRSIIDLFEQQVLDSPGAEAIRQDGQALTYLELNERANQVAWQLLSLGAGPEQLVAVRMDRCIEVVCAILGTLKTGAAYVPIDPSNPLERVAAILQQVHQAQGGAAPLLLTEPARVGDLPAGAARAVGLSAPAADEAFSRSNPGRMTTPGGLAYVIFTSGSTGVPKGVMIEHRSLVNYLWWARQAYVPCAGMAWPLFSSLAFDLTVTSLFTPLISGGRIVVYHDELWPHGTLVLKVLQDRAVNILKLTPAHLALIKDQDFHSTDLRVLIVGGEDFKTDLARAVVRQTGRPISIFNEYGPTEATVGCMIHRFDPELDRAPSVPIGLPAANVQVFVLDDAFKNVPAEVPGQLYLAGDGLARGYLNRGDLTRQRFFTIPDPAAPEATGPAPKLIRVYQTGDLARWTVDGQLIFMGRSDHQVKIGGARIELGEIEARLQEHPGIQACVVTVIQTGPDPALAAYYVSGHPLDAADLRGCLAKVLPEYMVPAHFIPMAGLPLTTNGKVDRAALPLPEPCQPGAAAPGEPLGATEARVLEIWKEGLKLPTIGPHDDFFLLGGRSLPAIRILTQITKAFGIEVPVSEFFNNPTVAELSEYLDRRGPGGKP